MAHVFVHMASAVPFLLLGDYPSAAGCLLPDAAWVPNEIRICKSGVGFARWIQGAPEAWLTPYRVTHSLLFLLLVFAVWRQLALGMLVHLLIDLVTHTGRMRQMPMYPVRWRWPWAWQKL